MLRSCLKTSLKTCLKTSLKTCLKLVDELDWLRTCLKLLFVFLGVIIIFCESWFGWADVQWPLKFFLFFVFGFIFHKSLNESGGILNGASIIAENLK